MADCCLSDLAFADPAPVGVEVAAAQDRGAPPGGVAFQVVDGKPYAWRSAPDPAAPANPPLAMGLAGIHDWSTEQPFIDVMKTARAWIGHLPGQWGGWDQDDLAAGGYLDQPGWPTAMPPELDGIATLILTDQPAGAVSLAGRYRLTYAGEGTIELGGRATNVRYRPGEIWFDYEPGEGFVILTITETDPRHRGEHIRDISVVKAENIELHEAGAIFNPRWIARVRDLRVVRFMNWMGTNDSDAAEWAGRPQPGDFSYAPAGAPVEVMVALANEIGADPWFTLPHQATDDYMRAFAEHVRDSLDPRLKAHVEYSNEIWNWQFGQAHWADAQARARWGREAPGDAWMQFAGIRAAETARIWDEVFGAEAERRLVKVIATQTGWLGLEQALLQAPLWVAEDPGNLPPAAYFDAYAVTGYFGGGLGSDKAEIVRRWIFDSRAAAAAEAEARGLAGPGRLRRRARLRSGGRSGGRRAARRLGERRPGGLARRPSRPDAPLSGERRTGARIRADHVRGRHPRGRRRRRR